MSQLTAKLFLFACAVTGTAWLAGCASIHGAKRVSLTEVKFKSAIGYRAEGGQTNVSFQLVENETGLAILVQLPGQKKALLVERAWHDLEGDHFVCWSDAYLFWSDWCNAQVDAVEFLKLEDGSRVIKVYGYGARAYTVVESNGIKRPVMYGAKPSPALVLFPVRPEGPLK